MRINAHIASAILPNDKTGRECFYNGDMKKSQINMEVVTAQKAIISAICSEYNTNTTAIAKKSGVAASTINRFMSAKMPTNALSALTMEAVRSAYPLNKENGEAKSYESQRAILKAIELIFSIMLAKHQVKKEDLGVLLASQAVEFQMQTLPNAAEVVRALIDSLDLKSSESTSLAARTHV